MKKLTERQVERLLREASGWEPETPMPESLIRAALAPRRRFAPMLWRTAIGLCGAAGIFAFLAGGFSSAPEPIAPTPGAYRSIAHGPRGPQPDRPAAPAKGVQLASFVRPAERPAAREPERSTPAPFPVQLASNRIQLASNRTAPRRERPPQEERRNAAERPSGRRRGAPVEKYRPNEDKMMVLPVVIAEPSEDGTEVHLTPAAVAFNSKMIEE